ncbi:MAG: succinylglutamate desuccinylase/aspartoacylase family protein [Flavobacteriaceae bacterium]|nr:succinylglutamate desuccinylase/aspartoacylase family protein [Flavobacteriaceae bacterium]
MKRITIDFYDQQIQLERILYSFHVSNTAPTVICFGGIHGNEPAGVYGLLKVIDAIKRKHIELQGNFYAIAGNLNALSKKIRYADIDLNRLWTPSHLAQLQASGPTDREQSEQLELYEIIKRIHSKSNGPYYFLDLHTTSAESIPFITISDSINNRNFAANFSVPTILGIEEYLEGPLLTFINEFGHISLGFEAGQHDDIKSVKNCESFIWQALLASNLISKKQLTASDTTKKLFNKLNFKKEFYEVDYSYQLNGNDDFMMINDFKNFSAIKKDQALAINGTKEITAQMKGYIFMPLYQKQGK